MARPGITREQVWQAADQLKGEGDDPTIEKIRARIGGSPNTVHKHFREWRQSQPQAQREAPQLPADLQAALVAEIDKQASAARAAAESEAIQAQEAADTLAEIGATLEEEAEKLRVQLEELENEKERAEAVASERKSEIERVNSQLAREMEAAESARMETAESRFTLDALTDQVAQLKTEVSDLTRALDEARAEQHLSAKTAAVAEANAQSQSQRADDLKSQITELKQEVSDARQQAQEAVRAKDQMQFDNAGLLESLNNEKAKNADLERQLKALEAALEKANNATRKTGKTSTSRKSAAPKRGNES